VIWKGLGGTGGGRDVAVRTRCGLGDTDERLSPQRPPGNMGKIEIPTLRKSRGVEPPRWGDRF